MSMKMTLSTIKQAVQEALEDLTTDDFLKFCDQLRDRGGKPRITRKAVGGKSVLEITNLLVSRFVERKALQVTLDTLRQIGCNQEAETLYSNTRACFDKGDLTLPKTLNGEAKTKASQEALKYAADQRPLQAARHGGPPVMAKEPKRVEAKAKANILSEGRAPCDDRLVLSSLTIPFGKYKGQTSKWLLENNVRYTITVVATHQMEREQTSRQDPMMSNKDSLTQYATAYPEVLKEVKAYQRSNQSDQAGKALIGFDSNTKACFDKGDPTLPKTLNGEVETKASQEALKYAADQRPLQAAQHGGPPVMAKEPKRVEAEAKARVLSEGGDPCNDRLVLSRFTIQFGKYKGQTFKWLLENHVGYAVYVVATHQMEREQTSRQDPMMSNKDSLTQYATAYPEVLKEVKAYQRSHQSDQAGKALVGFGTYRNETLQNLYKSKDPEKISYVDFLRGMESTCTPGSKMEVAIKYILKRDKQQAASVTEKHWS